jgi:hypothetical protein
MQIADCSRQQQDHKICYKNFLHKTPGTKSKKFKTEREREREKRQTHTNTHTDRHTKQREREREERRRNEKKLQIWELKLPPSLCVFVSPRAENKEKSASLPLFPGVSLFCFCFALLILACFAFLL